MTLKKALVWLMTGSVFLVLLTPFIFYTDLYFPFITGKAYYFRILVELGVAAWLGLMLLDPAYRPQRSCVLWSFTALIVVAGIATFAGVNPQYSFWSNFERMEGYVTFLHLFGFFFVLTAALRTHDLWKWFLNTAVVVGVLQVGWAALQVAGVLAVGMSQDRIDGTLGNATYLAIYMVFTFFIALFLLVTHRGEQWVRYWYGVAMLLTTIAVFWTATRGSLLGLIGGVAVTAGLLALAHRTNKRIRHAAYGVAGVVLVFAVLVIGFKDSAIVQNVNALRRVADISFTETTTIARFYNWNTAWQGIKERPILGYGLGNYAPIFDTYYNPKMWNQEQWFDRVHNIIFDWLVAAGFVGLLSYLSVLAVVVYYIYTRKGSFTASERAVLIGLLAAYCFHNLFVFDNLVSYIYFVILLGLVHTRVSTPFGGVCMTPVQQRVAVPAALVLLVLIFPLTVWAVNAPSYIQGTSLINALRISDASRIPEMQAHFERALARETFGDTETRQQLMVFTGRVVALPNVPREQKQALVDFTAAQMQREIDLRPRDPKFLALAGQFLMQTGNPEEALKVYEQAVSLSPQKQSLHQPVIEALFRLERPADARARAEAVYLIEPSNDVAWRQYARTLLRVQDTAAYDALIVEAFSTGRGDRVIGLALQNLESQRNNPQAYASLAVAYYQAGRMDEAVQVFTELGDVFPEAKAQADGLIKKIEAGEPIM